MAGSRVLEASFVDGNLRMTVLDGHAPVEIRWEPEGDCCSRSWIEHIEGVENLAGQTILEAWTSNGDRDDNHPDYDCLQIYFYKLRTTAGYVDIDMRNSSNGYYGGWLSPSVDLENITRYTSEDVLETYKRVGSEKEIRDLGGSRYH